MTDDERTGALMLALGVTRSQAVILSTLHKAAGRVVSFSHIVECLYPDSEPDGAEVCMRTFVCRIRARWGDGDIATAKGVGYALTPKGLARVSAALGEHLGHAA